MAKIIQVTTFFYPMHGGVEQQVLDLSKELEKNGHDVEVICSNATRTKEKISKKDDEIDGIKITRCSVLFSISQFYKFYPSLFLKLLKKDFDIVHVHGFRKFEVYLSLLAAKLKRKKIVVTTHNPFATDPKSRGRLLQLFVTIHDITFGKLFTRFINNIIALTEQEIPHIEKFGYNKKKIAVIPNGISEELYSKGNRAKFMKKYNLIKRSPKHIVLWVGRINKVKNLEALQVAIQQIPQAMFIFIGPKDNDAEKITKMYSAYKNVLFTGNIEHTTLIDAYAAADLFVLPSLHEAFGMVIIEAMAQGVPVMSTNVGGPKDIVNDKFGILLNPSDPWGWMLEMEKLLKSKKKREKMRIVAKKASQKYRWRNVIQSIIEVYEL